MVCPLLDVSLPNKFDRLLEELKMARDKLNLPSRVFRPARRVGYDCLGRCRR